MTDKLGSPHEVSVKLPWPPHEPFINRLTGTPGSAW